MRVFGPGSGSQACGDFGAGRLLEADAIVAELIAARGPRALADGMRVLVSAGPTFEDIDPVRYIGNRSSGRMGFAIAEAAAQQGASGDPDRRAGRAGDARRDDPCRCAQRTRNA